MILPLDRSLTPLWRQSGFSKEIDFGPVFNCSFARGFYGEWIPHNLWFYLQGGTWRGATFVAKTVTLDRHLGNVPLSKSGRPIFPFSRYVYWTPWSKDMFNAFGLSNPGVTTCLPYWQKFRKPFLISFTSIHPAPQERFREVSQLCTILHDELRKFRAPFGIILNFGCPNEGAYRDMDGNNLAEEAILFAEHIQSNIGLPVIFNCSPVMPLDVLVKVAEVYDALWPGNTIPFGHPSIDWQALGYNNQSPLQKRGLTPAGGYSGPAATPVSCDLIRSLREAGVTKPIIASNHIGNLKDLLDFREAGASDYGLGSIFYTDPKNMRNIIATCHRYAEEEIR